MKFFEEFRELGERRRFQATSEAESTEGWSAYSNPVCGDLLDVYVEVREGRVEILSYRCRGCWPVAAVAELLFDWAQGRTSDEVLTLSLDELLSWVEGVPAGKRHAFSLVHRGLLWSVARGLQPEPIGPDSKERLY